MKPTARKYRFEGMRLQAVVEMAFFWARLQGQQNLEQIQPVARKRPLARPAPKASGESGGCS
ncbi:MAG: hypothetical protein KatS3mg071_2725 [Meiothermus sp.]|nr:MAG: hypothetical protein KatS3mg071_2725 [Meiothermus sp.]